MKAMTDKQKKIFNRLLDEIEPLDGYLYAMDHEDMFPVKFKEIVKIEDSIRSFSGDDSMDADFRKAIMSYRKTIFLLDAEAKTRPNYQAPRP